MALVSNIGRSGGVASGGGARRSAVTVGGFSLPAAEGASSAAPAASVSAVSVDTLLALQQAPGEGVRDRKARRHGEAMLRLLARLQRAVLAADADERAVLAELGAMVEALPEAEDGRLRALVSAVALRVRVELARRP